MSRRSSPEGAFGPGAHSSSSPIAGPSRLADREADGQESSAGSSDASSLVFSEHEDGQWAAWEAGDEAESESQEGAASDPDESGRSSHHRHSGSSNHSHSSRSQSHLPPRQLPAHGPLLSSLPPASSLLPLVEDVLKDSSSTRIQGALSVAREYFQAAVRAERKQKRDEKQKRKAREKYRRERWEREEAASDKVRHGSNGRKRRRTNLNQERRQMAGRGESSSQSGSASDSDQTSQPLEQSWIEEEAERCLDWIDALSSNNPSLIGGSRRRRGSSASNRPRGRRSSPPATSLAAAATTPSPSPSPTSSSLAPRPPTLQRRRQMDSVAR